MTELIACLSTGKGTWAQVVKLIKGHEWEKVVLITNDFGKRTFQPPENTELVVVDTNAEIKDISKNIIAQCKDKLIGPEVAFNMVSGSGKEHMAVLSAVLKMGLGVRLVYMKDDSLEQL